MAKLLGFFCFMPARQAIRKELLSGGLCKREIAERLGATIEEVKAIAAAIKKQQPPTFAWK